MSEYEEAMIVLAVQQCEYLHIIAADRNPAKAKAASEKTVKALQQCSPAVYAFLGELAASNS
jgi:hypothetical protein